VGAHLLQRAMSWNSLEGNQTRFEKLMDMVRDTLREAGHDDRGADTFGGLVAGFHVATRDTYPDKPELAAWAKDLAAGNLTETNDKQATWRRCLTYMLDAAPDV